MAKPPAQFSPEPGGPGQPCGHSWYRSLRVDGKIPGKDYGTQFYVNLPPVATRPLPELGHDSDGERALLRSLQSQIDLMVDLLAQQREGSIGAQESGGTPSFLDAKQDGAIRWLLAGAQAALDAVGDVYERWLSYPLSQPDTAAGANPGCAGKQPYSTITTPRGDVIHCPGSVVYKQRREARSRIAALVVDAMFHIRCAQYRYQRLRLYAQAVDAFSRLPSSGGFGLGQATEQPTGPGPTVYQPIPGFEQYAPGGVQPPGQGGFAPTPPDVPEVDPGELPPPDSAGEPEPTGVVPTIRKLPTWAKVGGIAAVLVGAIAIMRH